MAGTVADLLHEWHDFYVLLGTASATLVGLMLVAASIGAGFYTGAHEAGMNTFITPTVVHFAAVLLICLLTTVPSHSWTSLGGLLGAGGLIGFLYSCRVWRAVRARHRRTRVAFVDRFWYALIPVLGYALIVGAAGALLLHAAASPYIMAAALIVLLLAGLRNAWDMTIWITLLSGKK